MKTPEQRIRIRAGGGLVLLWMGLSLPVLVQAVPVSGPAAASSAAETAPSDFGLRATEAPRKPVSAPYSDVRLVWRGKTYQVRLFDGVSQSIASATGFASQCSRAHSKTAVQEVLSLTALTPQAELVNPDGSLQPLTVQLRLIVQKAGAGCHISNTVVDEQETQIHSRQQNTARLGNRSLTLQLVGYSPRSTTPGLSGR